MTLKFTKISATGNDFILIDNRDGKLTGNENRFFQQICQRHVSVGADGILLLNKSDKYDFSLVYYNSDGNIGAMCGNGARAVAYYAYKHNISSEHVTFDVLGIFYHADITSAGVLLNMPPPTIVDMNVNIVDEKFYSEGGYVVLGVPHYVLFCNDLESINIDEVGRKYRYHSKFAPQGANINFIQISGQNKLNIRTYEKGVEDETFACGTGAASSAIIASTQKKMNVPIEVKAKGGILSVDFDDSLKNIRLTGMVEIIYDGELTVS